MAQLGTPRIEIVQPYGGVRVAWPGDRNRHEEMNLAPWTMLCWLQPEILREFLYSVAHATIGDRDSTGGREARISALEQEIWRLEYVEEAIVCDAEAAGIVIARHPGASPMAVLGIVRPAADAAAAQVAAE